MMTLEEQFPSLQYLIKESEKIAWDRMTSHQEFQKKLQDLKEGIMNHCLDKQRVREAIEEMRKKVLYDATYFKEGGTTWGFLKKELGLTEEGDE